MAQGSVLIARDNTDLTKGSTNNGQPGYPTPPDQYMSPSQLRDLFLQTAIYKNIMMDPVSYSQGSTLNIKVPQTGLAQKVRFLSTLTATTAANLAAAPTAKAPFSLITQLVYNDPSGNTRVNAPAWTLYNLMQVRRRYGFDPANGAVGGLASNTAVANLVYNNPTLTTAVQNVRFFVDVPITMSDFDTRGGLLLESATSPSFISLQFNNNPMDTNASASIESPYTNNSSATTITIAGSINPVYYYWSPAYVQGPHGAVLPIPVDDLNLVHEIITQRNSNALNANTDNRFTLPTGRSYYRAMASYVNNNAMSAGLTAVKFAYDNSNNTLNESLQAYFSRTRWDLDRDLPLGVYLWDFTHRPWDSNHYGQLDAILSFDGTSLTSPYVDYTRDTLYMAPIS